MSEHIEHIGSGYYPCPIYPTHLPTSLFLLWGFPGDVSVWKKLKTKKSTGESPLHNACSRGNVVCDCVNIIQYVPPPVVVALCYIHSTIILFPSCTVQPYSVSCVVYVHTVLPIYVPCVLSMYRIWPGTSCSLRGSVRTSRTMPGGLLSTRPAVTGSTLLLTYSSSPGRAPRSALETEPCTYVLVLCDLWTCVVYMYVRIDNQCMGVFRGYVPRMYMCVCDDVWTHIYECI